MKRGFFVICLIVLSLKGLAQCDQFVKQECLPQLGTYTSMGKRNTAVLLPGDTAQVAVTFYSGHQYRVVVCAPQLLGRVTFRILNTGGNVLFDSKEHNSPSYWNFNIGATQNVTIQLIVPPAMPNQVVQTGCVSLLIGFKSNP